MIKAFARQSGYSNQLISRPEKGNPLYTYQVELSFEVDVFVSMDEGGSSDAAMAEAVIEHIREYGLNGLSWPNGKAKAQGE